MHAPMNCIKCYIPYLQNMSNMDDHLWYAWYTPPKSLAQSNFFTFTPLPRPIGGLSVSNKYVVLCNYRTTIFYFHDAKLRFRDPRLPVRDKHV